MGKVMMAGLLLAGLATATVRSGDTAPLDPTSGATSTPAEAAATEVPRSADEQAVHDAVLDYVEGIYRVQPERIERSVHPTLRKYGYVRGEQGWGGTAMTFEQLRDLAATYNTNGRIGADAPKEITVFDVLDQTATAKLVADWGIDYFHLAKVEGRWQIMNVLWQTPPEM